MALTDLYMNFQLLFRWLHVIAGIIWIGHLYFFNFVNIPLQGSLDDAGKKIVNPLMMPRALWWFRWGAMFTLLTGLFLFFQVYLYTPGLGFGSTSSLVTPDGMTDRFMWIFMGMTFGIIMWFNVWFIIWPAQKKMLSGQVPTDQLPAVRKKVAGASKMNTYFSGPMLFGMLAPNHYGSINWVTAAVAIALGLIAIWFFYKTSPSAGKALLK